MVPCWILVALILSFVAGCGSTPTAAPVVERSPNANTAAKPAPTVAPTVPQQQPATATPPVTAAVDVPTTPQKNDKPSNSTSEQHARPADEPTTKAYREGDWRPEY